MPTKSRSSHERNIEEKLINLYKLQVIDSKIDEIKRLRGDSPLKIKDLEDEITGLLTRQRNLQNEIKQLEEQIKENEQKIKVLKDKISKYEKQLDNVRNNREYESLTKEIEYAKLDMQLSEKRIKEYTELLKEKQEALKETDEIILDKKQELDETKKELEEIMQETKKEEEKLLKIREELEKKVEERLLRGYNRIRNAMKNGLAVVPISQNGACGGCFNQIPPQRQLEVAAHRQIISCEFCGRILIDSEIVEKVHTELKDIVELKF